MTTKRILQELKTIRDIIYNRTDKQSNNLDSLKEKTEADLAYIAMMADVDMEEDETDE